MIAAAELQQELERQRAAELQHVRPMHHHRHAARQAAAKVSLDLGSKEKQNSVPNFHSVRTDMVLTAHKSIAPKCPPQLKTEDQVSSSTSNPAASRGCRRKIAFHPTLGYAITPPVPQKVARRNARERNRVKQVNCGFEMLRAHIPTAAKQKKMSKVDTLRHAVEYIQSLQLMLNEKHSGTNHSGSAGTTSDYQLGAHHHQQQPHQQQEQHPYPLTPQTPSFPNHPTNGNESGYDTSSSFFSTSTPATNLMSPPLSYDSHNCNSPSSSGSVFSYTPQTYTPQHTHPHQTYDQSFYADPNSEEDELLDVIAKWQEN